MKKEILIVVLALLIIGGGSYLYLSNEKTPNDSNENLQIEENEVSMDMPVPGTDDEVDEMTVEDNQIACTADAMQCPDGSWVGRTGPNCEFVCPEERHESCPLVEYNSYYFSNLERTFKYPNSYIPWVREDLLSFVPINWDYNTHTKGAYPILFYVSPYEKKIGFIYEEEVEKALSNQSDYHSEYMNNFENKPSKLFFDKSGDYYIECYASTECDKQICNYIIESVN